MLAKLQQMAEGGGIHITDVYLAHLKKDEERKILAYADALPWGEVDPKIRAHLEQHLYQAIQGEPGQLNFPAWYTGEVLSVDKVAGSAFERTANRPAVEVLEAIRDLPDPHPDRLIPLGNALAYKVLAAGAIKNHLLAVLRFHITVGGNQVPFAFTTLSDLEDREDSLLDEGRGAFRTEVLTNVLKKAAVSRAAFFPCLDDDGKEAADLLVFARTAGGAWFRALEATQRFSPAREGRTLVRLITEQNADGEVPHDLFQRMGDELLPLADSGLAADAVAASVERGVGHGIDREGFKLKWEAAFGDPNYRPAYGALFGEAPLRLKMQAGEIQLTLPPDCLQHFRQVHVGEETYIVFRVPERARVVVGQDLNLQIAPVDLADLQRWLMGEEGE